MKLLSAIVVLLMSQAVIAQPAYVAEELTIPSGISDVLLTDINDSDEIVGWGSLSLGHMGVYWPSSTTPVILDNDGSFSSTTIWGINNNGQVTGEFVGPLAGGGEQQGFLRWVPGQAPEFSGYFEGQSFSRGFDINDSGQITGFASYPPTNTFIAPGDTAPRVGIHAFLFDDINNVQFINTQNHNADAKKLNNNGTVIGRRDGIAYRYDSGVFTSLTIDPMGINANGMVVGKSGQFCDAYNNGTSSSINGFFDNTLYVCVPYAINNANEVVGSYQLQQGENLAFLFDGAYYNLNNITQFADSDIVLSRANGINEDGVIIAEGHRISDPSVSRYYKLTPVDSFDLAWLIPVLNLLVL